MVDQYVVTGYVKRIGKRDVISKPMSLRKANNFLVDKKVEMRLAIPKYRWVTKLKIKKIIP